MKKPPKYEEALKASTRPLTDVELAFVQNFDGGDPVEALRLAGFEGNEHALGRKATQLLGMPAIRRALRAKDGYTPNILDELDLQEFLTRTASDPDVQTKDKLRAAELLMKNKGMLVERVKHEGGGLEDIINRAMEMRKEKEAPTE